MDKNRKKDLKYYLSMPWQFEFTQHLDGKYSARVVGLSCYSGGDTIEEAAKEIKSALEFYLESCLEDNLPVLEPDDISKANGRISLRTSKKTHLRLLEIAKAEDVSVSHLINDAIIKQYG